MKKKSKIITGAIDTLYLPKTFEVEKKQLKKCAIMHNRSNNKIIEKVHDTDELNLRDYEIYKNILIDRSKVKKTLQELINANHDIFEPLDNPIAADTLKNLDDFLDILFGNNKFYRINEKGKKVKLSNAEKLKRQESIKFLVQIITEIYQESYLTYYQKLENVGISKKKDIEDFKRELKISDRYLNFYECKFMHICDNYKYRDNIEFISDNNKKIQNLVDQVTDNNDTKKELIIKIQKMICDYRDKIRVDYNVEARAYDEMEEDELHLEWSRESLLKDFENLEPYQKYLIVNYFDIYETLVADPIPITPKQTIYLYDLLCAYTLLDSDDDRKVFLNYMEKRPKYVKIESSTYPEKIISYQKLRDLDIEKVEINETMLKDEFLEKYFNDDFVLEYFPKRENDFFKYITTMDKADWDFLIDFLMCKIKNPIVKELEKLCKKLNK